MIQTRHRLMAALAAVVALAVASQASAQTSLLILSYSDAKTFGNVHVAGGAIDLTNGAMIVTTSSFGFVPTGGFADEYGSPGQPEYGRNAIHDALIEGANYSNGLWNGTNGIISSSAATDPLTNKGIGWLDNSIGAYSTFKGVPVSADQSIIAYTYLGDADLSGFVDGSDYGLWSAAFNLPTSQVYGSGGVEWADGDWDQSGLSDGSDYGLFSATFGLSPLYSAAPIVPSAQVGAAIAPVPEPSTFLLFGVAALCGVGYRFVRKSRA